MHKKAYRSGVDFDAEFSGLWSRQCDPHYSVGANANLFFSNWGSPVPIYSKSYNPAIPKPKPIDKTINLFYSFPSN